MKPIKLSISPSSLNANKSPIRLLMHGSCVSRDILRVCEESSKTKHFNWDYFFCRQSIISTVSPTIKLELDDIESDSPFQKRMVFSDFNKTLPNTLQNVPFDFVLIDFVDERYRVCEHNNSYLTMSTEFINARLHERIDCRPLSDKEQKELWSKSIVNYVSLLDEYIQEYRVILNIHYWAKNFIENGKLIDFDAATQKDIAYQNEMLKWKQERLLQLTKDKIRCIYDSEENIANAHHKWGKSPYHYIDNHYENLYKQLKEICEIRD